MVDLLCGGSALSICGPLKASVEVSSATQEQVTPRNRISKTIALRVEITPARASQLVTSPLILASGS